MSNRIRIALQYVVSIHIISLLILSLLRVILLFTNVEFIDNAIFKSDVVSALLRGVWFDNVIASYITILPLAVLSIGSIFSKLGKKIYLSFDIYYIVFYGIIFAISTADVPYFNYFFKHLNYSIFNWKEEGGNAVEMIFQESSYYIYFMIYIITLIVYIVIISKISRWVQRTVSNTKPTTKQLFVYVPLSILLICSTILGIRGRIGRNPIKTSQAYFCNNSFLNQLGLNPTFFLLRSIIENTQKHVSVNSLMSEQEAILAVQKELNTHSDKTKLSPIYRIVNGDTIKKDVNIVFILMESMSADLLTTKQGKLTPFLNQLKNESYYFDHFYTAGNHTNHGVTATLYGIPSLFDKNMMKNVEIPQCEGLPNLLDKIGYNNLFFVTHESQYDNMNAFLLENGIKRMFAQEDYPRSKVVNGFGVQDDFLFEYAINQLNQYSKEDKPFFATILTVSNHPPYVVPDKYKNVSDKPEEQIVAFADDAIKQFITEAKKQPWYCNTIFVLLGDHGKIVGNPIYDMPLSYNHVPLIIHSELLQDSPKVIHNLGGQVDVFPTIMGLLNYSYSNNTLGVDILKTKRDYMYFTSDDLMGCIGEKYFYIYNPVNKMEGLYDYQSQSTQNKVNSFKALADGMRTYAASMLITTDYLLRNKLLREN